jgi:hypothetical protein
MPACLPSVYLFLGALFLFCPGSGNLAGAVEDGRSAETGERGGERSGGGGAVQHRILIPLSLLIVLPVVSSAVFLSVRPSLIAVGFGLSFQLLSRGFSFRHGGGEGGRWKREKEGEEAGKQAFADQTAGMTERASTPLSICLSEPKIA